MKECPPCQEMAPAFEKLAKNMKAIGIKVGKINVEDNQDIARQYNIQQVPKLYLFRPNKEPEEYQGDRTERTMKTFILDLQLGEKQVTQLTKEERINKFFNESSRIPRVLLLSSRKDVAPVFKQICYHHRRGVVCGFVSELHDSINEVKEKLTIFGNVSTEEMEYPEIYVINPRGTPRLNKYNGKHNYEAINEFVSEFSLWKEKEDPEERKERERKQRAEERKKKREEDKAKREEDKIKREEAKQKRIAEKKAKKAAEAAAETEGKSEI